jgi:hypothetical protein
MTVPYIFGTLTGTPPIDVPASELDDNFSYLLGLVPSPTTIACITNQLLTTGQSLNTFTNAGAGGAVTLTLPTPTAGLLYIFVVAANQTLTIAAGGSVVIALGEVTSTAGGNISSSTSYSAVTLRAISASVWAALSITGTWTPA